MYAKGSAEWDERLAVQRNADEAFAEAYWRTHPNSTPGLAEIRQLGWTTAAIEHVERLALWAIEQRTFTGTATTSDESDPQGQLHEVYDALEVHGSLLMDRGALTAETMRPWLALVAGAPDFDARAELRRIIVLTPDGSRARWAGDTVLDVWRRTAPSEVAALAHAAGLTPKELATQQQGEDVDLDRLRLLAGLRGFRLPPVDLFS